MNNLYNWHDERMVEHEMHEIDREIEQARLLREAGISDTNWLASAFGALSTWLNAMGERLRNRSSTEHPHRQSTSPKAASE
jgi:hypothetical protein